MATLIEDARIAIPLFTRQSEGAEVVIGNPANGLFLALPADAVEVLDLVAAGYSIASIQERYLEKYGEVPDVEELLEALARKGFLTGREPAGGVADPAHTKANIKYHFADIPESFAKKIFSRPVLLCGGFLCASALAVLVAEPQIRPTRKALFFTENVTAMLMLIMAVSLLTTFLHEMAHLVAARARGVSCRLGIGNRLWVLVAETDMSGVWALPRRERYLPILAGPILDLVSVSLLVLILFAGSHGWLRLPTTVERLMHATVFIYLLRLAWQTFLFVRTDVYYLYATCWGCKNLMTDTQDYLKNLAVSLLRYGKLVEQAHIPRTEMRAIRFYALLWLVGRGMAFGVLFLVTLPLAWEYLLQISSRIAHRHEGSTYQLVDAVLITGMSLLFAIAGFGLWIRELVSSRRIHEPS